MTSSFSISRLPATWSSRGFGSRLDSSARLLRQDLFGGGCVDLDRQAWDKRARTTVAGKNNRAGDDEFHGIPHIPLTAYSMKAIFTP